MTQGLLLHGGRVWTGSGAPLSGAVLLRGGKVAALGEAALDAAGADDRRLDLGGRLATPALDEAHMHLLPYGLGLVQVNLRPDQVPTLDALLTRIADAAAVTPKGAWVIGRGYDHTALDVGRHPTAAELDRAAPDNPVFIKRTCGHMGVANAAAMRIAGVGHNTPDPEGGVIERGPRGLTGLFQERALRLILDVTPVPDETAMVTAIEAAGRNLAGFGFASASDMNVGMTAGLAELAAYRRALAEDRLRQRMWLVLAANPEGIAEAAWAGGLRPDIADPMLACGAVKVFADGSAGGMTAAFMDPYLPGGTGVFCFPDATMHGLLALWHGRGFALNIHAIGDAAIEQVLKGMEDLPDPRPRHRIEHAGWANRHQRRRMLAAGVIPVPQPIFLYEFGDSYITVLGPERANACYPMRTFVEEGHNPSASSDSPVSTVDPFVNFFTMRTRQTSRGRVLGAGETLTAEQALHAYTSAGAFARFAETRRGTLAVGMDADVAVFDTDLLEASPEAVMAARCDLTIRGGQVIHDRHAALD